MKVYQKVVLVGAGSIGGGLATYGVGWLVGDYWAGLAVLVPLFYLLGRAEGRANRKSESYTNVLVRHEVQDDDFCNLEGLPRKQRRGQK